MAYELDQQEIKIVKELIVNPRCSDNQISKNTAVPLKTVNTKRKKLQDLGYLRFYTEIDNSLKGTGLFKSRQMVKLYLKPGVSRHEVVNKIPSLTTNVIFKKHMYEIYLGEHNGSLVIVCVVESFKDSDIIEIINADLIPLLNREFGREIVDRIESIMIRSQIRLFHNYMPNVNMTKGMISSSWPKNQVFVYEK